MHVKLNGYDRVFIIISYHSEYMRSYDTYTGATPGFSRGDGFKSFCARSSQLRARSPLQSWPLKAGPGSVRHLDALSC